MKCLSVPMATSGQRSERWWLLGCLVLAMCGCCVGAGRDRQFSPEDDVRVRKISLDGTVLRGQTQQRPRRQKSDRPNIVVIMTDDQDLLLGSLRVMPKLRELLIKEGAFFNNSFVSTPMCCPSRSSFLTGLYVHNHNTYTNNENCSSPQWQRQHEPRTFATYLHSAGYKTGYFGKYLNKYNGTYVPPGYDKWVGLVRNSRFYNYSLSYNGEITKHLDNYYKDYLTDLVGNDSVAFFKRSKRLFPTKPVMMVLGLPAPHGPEDAAPQYQHMFVNNTDHRTPSWNFAPNEDKQWLLRQTQPMTPQYKIFTDLLQRRRLQTLQSVDDLVEKVYTEVKLLGELDNTYFIYTSDHGYHLGQFGLIKGKSMSYDFDTRVPLIISGPGIKAGSIIHNIAVNPDIAPTILEMGGLQPPAFMDGTSLLPLLKATPDLRRSDDKVFLSPKGPWRDSILLERGKLTKRLLKLKMREEKQALIQQNQKNLYPYLPPKQQKVLRQCSNPTRRFQLPCTPEQRWYCEKDSTGKMRLHKCRYADRDRNYNDNANVVLPQKDQPTNCRCSDGNLGYRVPNTEIYDDDVDEDDEIQHRRRRHRHRRFLRQKKQQRARAKLVRRRRAVMQDAVQFGAGGDLGLPSGFDMLTRRCRILMNSTVTCDQDLYRDFSEWAQHRERLDEMIKEYKKILQDLKNIRDHLQENQPPHYIETLDKENTVEEEDQAETRFEPLGEDEICFCENDTTSRDERRRLRKEQKQARRQDEKQQKRGGKRNKKRKKNCNGQNMKCFSHDNDHWKTPPYWSLFGEEEGGDVAQGCPSLRQHRRLNYPHCGRAGMECALMDNCHWKTPPFWTHGPFCFCSNSNNNTYWCMRTVNATHDVLYCEYITNFIAYYDMNTDPFQLDNVAKQLNYGILQQLHDQLAYLKVCQGRHDCDISNFKDMNRLTSFEGSSGEGDDYEDEDFEDNLFPLYRDNVNSADYEEVQYPDADDPDSDFF